jgi:hypothetical protein
MEHTWKQSDELKISLDLRLDMVAVDLGDLDALEEDIVPCTGCGCSKCC